MRVPLWITDSAEAFWAAVGETETFPRDLQRPIARSLPLATVLLPELGVDRIERWFRQQDIFCNIGVDDRKLRACLVARFGQGLIFADGRDAESELRFSIAHELAHFLIDYWSPRNEAVSHLGIGILEVLDGKRPANATERSDAVLVGQRIGYHVHLMDRSQTGVPANNLVAMVEARADRLAFELLAPSDVVLRAVGDVANDTRRQAVTELLSDFFGLPRNEATRYGEFLIPSDEPPHSLLNSFSFDP